MANRRRALWLLRQWHRDLKMRNPEGGAWKHRECNLGSLLAVDDHGKAWQHGGVCHVARRPRRDDGRPRAQHTLSLHYRARVKRPSSPQVSLVTCLQMEPRPGQKTDLMSSTETWKPPLNSVLQCTRPKRSRQGGPLAGSHEMLAADDQGSSLQTTKSRAMGHCYTSQYQSDTTVVLFLFWKS